MARKELTVIIDADGRDKDKVFKIREMPAIQAERWATRLLLGLAKSGVEIPDDIQNAGMAGVASLAMRAIGGIDFTDAEPLLAEMMDCITIIPDPSNPAIARPWIEEDFEEVATIFKLRKEVFNLHVNFSTLAARLTSAPATAPAASSNTKTSRVRSAR